jgi:transcriptional regulator with XRE-family HTH domain
MSTRSVSLPRYWRLGRELSALREASQMTQRQAAAAARISRNTVMRAEAGSHRPRREKLCALLDVYGPPLDLRAKLLTLMDDVGPVDPQWRKSTASADGACLEWGFLPGLVLLRRGDDPKGPVLEITSEVFDGFIADIESGLFRPVSTVPAPSEPDSSQGTILLPAPSMTRVPGGARHP